MRRFFTTSLLLRFSALSFLVIAGLGIGLSVLVRDQVEDRALTDAERLGAALALSVIEDHVTPRDLERLPSPERLTEFDDAFGESGVHDMGFERIKIFNHEPRIVYSDDHAQVGRSAADSHHVRQALDGELVSKIETGVDHSGEGERTLEVFVPLPERRGSGRAGVLEIYLPYAPVAAAARADALKLNGALAAGLLILWLALFRIVSTSSRALREHADHNRRLALQDSLTKLSNRVDLAERAADVLPLTRSDRRAGLLLVDLDHFKEVNDTLGHQHGDELLCQVAARLSPLLGPDQLLARLGGDEFAVLLPDVPDGNALEAYASIIRNALQQPFEVAGLTVSIDGSVGGALAPDHGCKLEDLLKHADVAMYAAKDAGDGYRLYNCDFDPYSEQRLGLAGELRGALDRGELVLHYQPIVSVGQGEEPMVEALLRWQHPERGLLPPGEFLPLAERVGCMGQITRLVIGSALAQAYEWSQRGLDVSVACNIDPASAVDPRLPETVAELLGQWPVDPARLTLELSEETLMTDLRRVGVVMSRVHALGVKLALDDFGTGRASLASLRGLPLDQLKLDRSFVMPLDEDPRSADVLGAVVAVARSFGMETVAEGVETEEVADRLAKLGCDHLQGFLFSRPVPPEEAERWMQAPVHRVIFAA